MCATGSSTWWPPRARGMVESPDLPQRTAQAGTDIGADGHAAIRRGLWRMETLSGALRGNRRGHLHPGTREKRGLVPPSGLYLRLPAETTGAAFVGAAQTACTDFFGDVAERFGTAGIPIGNEILRCGRRRHRNDFRVSGVLCLHCRPAERQGLSGFRKFSESFRRQAVRLAQIRLQPGKSLCQSFF